MKRATTFGARPAMSSSPTLACALLLAGCTTASGPAHAIDLSTAPADLASMEDLAGTSGDLAGGKSYLASSIAGMRMGAPGDYALADVVVLAVTPSTKAPRLFVQDAAGGDLSAVMADCSSTSTAHKCTVNATVAGLTVGHKVTLKGTYIRSAANKGGFETFYIDSAVDGGAGTLPAVTAMAMADVERGASKRAQWFQHVSVTLGEALLMYDWTPSEFVYSGATQCPYQFGFGMIPTSAGGTAKPACSGTSSQPAGQTSPSASEILIGTDFYATYTVSSDCRCTAMFSAKAPTSTSKLTGTLAGILVYDVPYMTSAGYQYIAPIQPSDAALTNTM